VSRSRTGIVKRHGRKCRSREGGSCNCQPSYEASVWSPRDGRKIRRSFPSGAAAKTWRSDAFGQVRRGALKAPSPQTVREAGDERSPGPGRGRSSRGGVPYKPSPLRTYERDLRRYRVTVLLRRSCRRSESMTDRYRHLIEGQAQAAVAAFDRWLSGWTGAQTGAHRPQTVSVSQISPASQA
jgi:hypothetical protein